MDKIIEEKKDVEEIVGVIKNMSADNKKFALGVITGMSLVGIPKEQKEGDKDETD